MKQYTHAWLALKAISYLRKNQARFQPPHSDYVKSFLDFICSYTDTFIRGAWYPDLVIQDNLTGGHTWKYSLDPNGKNEKRRPPTHNLMQGFVSADLGQPVALELPDSALPDRCEALGQMIRDMVKITNKSKSWDVIAFNRSQMALSFLMLAHYVCDAHVPVHCDHRDLGTPSKVHPDLEDYWEDEIEKHYWLTIDKEKFVTDEKDEMIVKTEAQAYQQSFLYQCDQLLDQTPWENMNTTNANWTAFLGKNNNNFWDYEVSVCLVSFFASLRMFPLVPPAGVDYNTVRIRKTSPFKESLVEFSPRILADAVSSVALIWLAAWERWKLVPKVA